MAALYIRVAASESKHQQHKSDDQGRGALVTLDLGGSANPRRSTYSQPRLQGGKNCGLYPSCPEH